MNQQSESLTFLQKLMTGFQRSKNAYLAYQENGKTFSLAEAIREENQVLSELLATNIDLLSQPLQTDARELLYHYKVWTEKWDDLKEQINPKPEHEFIFANAFSFPRAAADRLMEEYTSLKKNAE